jgi:acetyl/propionyl-CoA carboxylase alpha subunit
LDDAVKLCQDVGYSNAGTVEFLVEPATGEKPTGAVYMYMYIRWSFKTYKTVLGDMDPV